MPEKFPFDPFAPGPKVPLAKRYQIEALPVIEPTKPKSEAAIRKAWKDHEKALRTAKFIADQRARAERIKTRHALILERSKGPR